MYYISGESKQAVENSLLLERLKRKGYEVLYMVEAIDKDAIGKLKKYEGKKLVSATKEETQTEETPKKARCRRPTKFPPSFGF